MKLFSSSLGLFLTVTRVAPTRGSTVTVTELNENPGCEGRTTAVYATITPGTCAENDKADHCTAENGWGLLSSEYTFCEFDRAAYPQYAFATPYYVLVEFYWDTPCENLWHTVALLADGQCHQTVQETIMVTTDAEGTLYLQNRGLDCERGLWGNITEPVPKAMVNSGECFVGKDISTRVYLVDGTAAASSSASSGASSSSTKTNTNTNTTDTTNGANTTAYSYATSILHTTPYALVVTALTVAGALAAMY